MADTKNTEVPPASEPAAPGQPSPVVVREKRSWAMPLISALVVVAALVVGGIGGFAIATATHAGGRPALEQGQVHGAPGQQGGPQGQGKQGQGPQGQGGPQQGPGHGGPPPGGPGGQHDGERPTPPSDDIDPTEG